MKKILTIAAMALMLSACSNDIEQTQPKTQSEGIPFTATISIGEGATTRALTEDATNSEIVPSWAKGEKVALIHDGVNDEMTVESVSDGVATITGTITGSPADGAAVTIIYPSSAVDATTKNVKTNLLASQDGTLSTIATNYDVRKGAAQLNVGNTASLHGNVSLDNQFAIVKFSLSDGSNALSATKFLIKDGSNNVITTVTPASATSTLYVAMAPATASAFKFEATAGSFNYTYTKSDATLAAGKYYQSPLSLAKIDLDHTPLTLEAIEAGTIQVTFDDGLDLAKPITYTKNGAEYSGGTTDFSITVAAGDVVTFHSTNAALGKLVGYSYNHPNIKPTNRCYIYGNIMSLINDAGDFATDKIIGDKLALYALFSGANKLENDPAKDILLPATTLTDYCYNELFSGCSALTKAPALPATVLKLRCYEQMFWQCTSLTEAPIISATTVDDYCCHDMFNGCTSLVKAPELLATTLAQYCYNGMFWGCSKLNYLKCLATDVSADNCLGGWLDNVSATGTLVVDFGTKWAVAGTNYPSGWALNYPDGTGIMSVTASGYSGIYDGDPHSITVIAPSGATIKYGTTEGVYDLTTNPTYTDADSYTVYYQVTKSGYATVTGYATVVILSTTGSISYTTTEITKKYGDAAFKNETLTKTGDGVVTYSSNNTAVAEVNKSTGEVTIKGAGTAYITATVADSKNYTYTPNSAQYTLIVKPASGVQNYNNGGEQTW